MPQEPANPASSNPASSSPESDQLGDLFAPAGTRRHAITRWVFFALGGLLVAYGILGVLLPILPGFPFLLVGMPLMAGSSERARGWMNRLDRRFPLGLRLLLRRFQLVAPPKGGSPEQWRRWRVNLLWTAAMWLGCGLFFSALAVAMRWLWVAYLQPLY